MSLREKVVHGLLWSLASRVGGQAFQFAFGVVLARLLSPNEFGTIGMLLVFTGFAQALADCGLSAALIQIQVVTERDCSTVFWLQFAIALCLCGLLWVSAPAIAAFYALPAIEMPCRLMSGIFPLQALGYTHSSLLSKQFQFRALAIISVVSIATSGIAAVALAAYGFGIWALVWQSMVAALVTTALLWMRSHWRPSFLFDREAAVKLSRYGIYLLGHGSLNYWIRNGDNLLIGKFLGAHSLGIYARAYSLMLLPLNNIGAVLGQVMFPALSQVQHDIPRFRKSYLTATRVIALISFPIMIGIAVLAEPFIAVLYGEKWAEVYPLLQVLSLVGLFQSIIFPVGWIFTSLGKTKAQFLLSVPLAFMFIIAIIWGIRYGLIGVTYAYAIWTLWAGVLNLHLAGKYIGLTASNILMSVVPIGLMSGAMGLVVFMVDAFLLKTYLPAIQLLASGALGGLIYLTLCIITKDETFVELLLLISTKIDHDLVPARLKSIP